jgi:transcriptional regulator with XRE-family HTH domain
VYVPKSVFTAPYGVFLALLKKTRLDAGVSQVELARRLGRPQPFISYIERGERRVDVIEFCAIMRALGADPEASFSDLVRKLPGQLEM